MKEETDIEKLATLSRISVSYEEQKALKADIDSILSYIKQIKDITTKISPEAVGPHNVMREDGEPHETGVYTKELLSEVPLVKGDYVEVKRIIDQDK